MAVTVYQVDSEPIIIASYSGFVTADDIETMFRETNMLLASIEPPVYRITDFRHIESDIEEAIDALREAMRGHSGASTDPRVRPILLGNNAWVRLVETTLKSHLLDMPIFMTLGDAMRFARDAIKHQRRSDAS